MQKRVQTPACDRCSQGVMDADSDHLWGSCKCDCHDWPHCKRCGSYEWDHRDGALDHRMQWPPMTARELRVANRIMEALR